MRRIRGLVSIGLLALIPAQSMAQTAGPCLNPADAESLVAFALPTAIHILGDQCGKVLPPETGFSAMARDLEKQYQAGSDTAWPAARTAMQTLLEQSGKQDSAAAVFKNLLKQDNPTSVRDTVISMLETKPISPRACRIVDRILPALQPIPPKGLAGLLAAIIEAVIEDGAQGGKAAKLRLCPVPPTA